jgi:hypothetical protein
MNSVNTYFEVLLRESRSRDGSLVIVTRPRAGRPEESVFDPGKRRVICLSTASRPTVGPTELPIQWDLHGLLPQG